eukprot:TRINITY_DN1284_c0_g1_i3.p1 TRINITY_DN1284_c0_g1~~TRINITY_DN1284_c0_g1_i3.p1  ORF type:complete len:693 (+),score=175.50 TRINITY_DN1284_c0_g1_i3:101-2080(+)
MALGITTNETVLVERLGAPLIPQLAAPSSIGSDQPLFLDASASYDPDGTAGAASFAWTCRLCTTSDVDSCTQPCVGFSSSNSATLTLAAGTLIAQRSYLFTVAYTKGLRSATTGRIISVLAPSSVQVSVRVSQPDVLSQLTRQLALNTSVCATVNPAVEVVITLSATGSAAALSWIFEAIESNADLAVPFQAAQTAVSTGVLGNALSLPSDTIRQWPGYSWHIRVKAIVGGQEIGACEVCFVVGVPPEISSFSAAQVEKSLRYTAAVADKSLSADFLIGYRAQPGGPRVFWSFSQGFRLSSYRSGSSLSYSVTLFPLLPPCPAAVTYPFVLVCRSGVCSEYTTEADLDCSFKRVASNKRSVGECSATPDPLEQALCAVQAVQAAPSVAAAAQALDVVGATHSTIPASYAALLLFANHHAAIVRAAAPSDVTVLQQLLADPSYALPETLEALFSSTAKQTASQCTGAAESVVAAFGQKALETVVCGGMPLAFSSSGLSVGIANAIVPADGTLPVALGGGIVSNLVLTSAGSSSCISVAASIRSTAGCDDGTQFVLAIAADSGLTEVAFDSSTEGDCAAWDSQGVWNRAKCTRSGDTCTCQSAAKFTVLAKAEPPNSSGSSNAGAIAGGVIGALAGVGAGVGAFVWWRKHRGGGGRDVEMR